MTSSLGSLGHKPWWRTRRAHCAPGPGRSIVVYCKDLRIEDPATCARLIDGVTLGFRSGSLTALLDPAEARSRALFSTILGFTSPTLGVVQTKPRTPGFRDRLASVSLITPHTPIDPSLTVRENLIAPLALTGVSTDGASFASALSIAGLVPYEHTLGADLSPLDCFRLLLARALVCGTDIVLASATHELLNAKDRETALQLLRSLSDHGLCVILATSSPEDAATCDRAIVFHDGSVSADLLSPTDREIASALDTGPEDPATLVGPIPPALPSAPIGEDEARTLGPETPLGRPPFRPVASLPATEQPHDGEDDSAAHREIAPKMPVESGPTPGLEPEPKRHAIPGSEQSNTGAPEQIITPDPAPESQQSTTPEPQQSTPPPPSEDHPASEVTSEAEQHATSTEDQYPHHAGGDTSTSDHNKSAVLTPDRRLTEQPRAPYRALRHAVPEPSPAPPSPTPEQVDVIDRARRILEELPGPIVPED